MPSTLREQNNIYILEFEGDLKSSPELAKLGEYLKKIEMEKLPRLVVYQKEKTISLDSEELIGDLIKILIEYSKKYTDKTKIHLGFVNLHGDLTSKLERFRLLEMFKIYSHASLEEAVASLSE